MLWTLPLGVSACASLAHQHIPRSSLQAPTAKTSIQLSSEFSYIVQLRGLRPVNSKHILAPGEYVAEFEDPSGRGVYFRGPEKCLRTINLDPNSGTIVREMSAGTECGIFVPRDTHAPIKIYVYRDKWNAARTSADLDELSTQQMVRTQNGYGPTPAAPLVPAAVGSAIGGALVGAIIAADHADDDLPKLLAETFQPTDGMLRSAINK